MDEMLDLRRPLTMDEVTMLLGQRDVAIYQLTRRLSVLATQLAQREAEIRKLQEPPPQEPPPPAET